MSEPMPPMNQDPVYTQSQEVKRTLADVIRRFRPPDTRLTDLQRAAIIVNAYNAAIRALQELWADWDKRADARLDWLEEKQPIGPGIPNDTNTADRQVLLSSFRSSLAEARDADLHKRQQMYADSVRFGDELMRRAVITSMVEANERRELSDLMTAEDPEAGVALDEWLNLSGLRSGTGFSAEALFKSQGMTQPEQPAEVRGLDHLANLAGISASSVLTSADVTSALRHAAAETGASWLAD